MKLNLAERLITGNPVRAYIQRHFEGPMLKGMGSRSSYPLCLEIGCGSGTGAQVIAEQFGAGKVIATDIDPDQIKRARKNLPPELEEKIEFRVEDAMTLQEADEMFDAVFSFGVLHHLEDWKKALKEIARVLKTGGEFFFEEPLRPFLQNVLVRAVTEHPKGGEFDFQEFKDELGRNAIGIVNMKRIGNIAVFCVGRKA